MVGCVSGACSPRWSPSSSPARRCSCSCPRRTWPGASTSLPTPAPAPHCRSPAAWPATPRRPSSPSRGPPPVRPGWVDSSVSRPVSTPRCGAGSATPSSCGCVPTGLRTGSVRPSTGGTAPTGAPHPRRTARNDSTRAHRSSSPARTCPRRRRRRTSRRSTSCSRRPTWCSTPTPRTRCGSPPMTSSSPTATRSSPRSGSAPAPSTRWRPT